MEPVTVLLGGVLFIFALLFLEANKSTKTEVARRVNKLHGPRSYPIFGTDLPLLFVRRKGK